jgi:PAP2 superfamily
MTFRKHSLGLTALAGAAVLSLATAAFAQAPSLAGQAWLSGEPQASQPQQKSDLQDELRQLKAAIARRTPEDAARIRWWAAGGPVYRWNEIVLGEITESFVTTPLALRHLALLHTALDDATATARASKRPAARKAPGVLDPAIIAIGQAPDASGASEHAAAATAAGDILAHVFPAKAAAFAAKAEEAISARLLSGHEFPADIAEGRVIGKRVAALAIARGKMDGSDAKWTGAIPEGPDKWRGQNPVAPLAGTWRPWVLAKGDEFRPAAPPAIDSEATKAALAELKAYPRTPKSNHRALFWEVNGGARIFVLWNEIARMKLLEHADILPPSAAPRILAALNVALADTGIACWDAKYAYWLIRPPQLDPEVKPLFPTPNHPSYPAAHACLSTAAVTVLARAFPMDREALLALGKEASEARIWAGIHYRFDIDAGQALGRAVGEKTIEQAFRPKAL